MSEPVEGTVLGTPRLGNDPGEMTEQTKILLDVLSELSAKWLDAAENHYRRANQFSVFSPPHMIYQSEGAVLEAAASELRECVLQFGQVQELTRMVVDDVRENLKHWADETTRKLAEDEKL